MRTRKRCASLIQKHAPVAGKFYSPPDAVEKRCTIALFKIANGGTHRRWREMQGFRSARQVFTLGHLDENSQLLQRHNRNRSILSNDLCHIMRWNE